MDVAPVVVLNQVHEPIFPQPSVETSPSRHHLDPMLAIDVMAFVVLPLLWILLMSWVDHKRKKELRQSEES
jgi:hypothetical protein